VADVRAIVLRFRARRDCPGADRGVCRERAADLLEGNIALPDSLARLITLTDSQKPTVLVSLGSPYLLNQTPTVKSYVIAWSGVRAAERAASRACSAGHRSAASCRFAFRRHIPSDTAWW